MIDYVQSAQQFGRKRFIDLKLSLKIKKQIIEESIFDMKESYEFIP